MPSKRALIVEDDADLAQLVQINLRDIDCQSDIAATGPEGLRRATEERWLLVSNHDPVTAWGYAVGDGKGVRLEESA